MKIIKKNAARLRVTACVLAAILVLGSVLLPVRQVSAASTYDVQVTGKLMRSKLPQLLKLINNARKQAGVPTLQFDEKAMKIAELRAAQASLVFDHTAPDGENPKSWSTIDREPIFDDTWGNENLHFESTYKNVNIAARTFDGWYHSSSHRESLLRSGVSRVGLAIFRSTGRSELRNYTVVFVSMRELTDSYYGGAKKSPDKPREKLIPYTGGFKNTVKTFQFQTKSGNVKLMPGPRKVKIKVGKTVSKKPCYYQLSGTSKIPSAYYFDSACGKWSSSDKKVAAVAEDGTVTGISPGTATITFSLNGKHAKSVSYKVKVRKKI